MYSSRIINIPKKATKPKFKSKTKFVKLISDADNVVREKIFTNLDHSSKLAARQVCIKWKSLIDEVLPFRVILNQKTFPDVVQFAVSSKKKVSELVVGYFAYEYPSDNWGFIDVHSLKLLSNNELPVGTFMPKETLDKLFAEFQELENLFIASSSLTALKPNSILKTLSFPFLSSLEIIVEQTNHPVTDIMSQTFPKLLKFSITIHAEDDMAFYGDTFSLLSRHPALNDVKRNIIYPNDCYDQNANTQLDHNIDPALYKEILGNISRLKLSSLDFHALSCEGKVRNNLGLHLLKAQTVLTVFHISNIRRENMQVWRTIPTILGLCSSTLKSVILDGCLCKRGIVDPPGPFCCQWMEQCKSLDSLELLICGIRVADDISLLSPNIKTLCLGRMLTLKQMRSMTDYFKKLEVLSWPQMNSNKCELEDLNTHLYDGSESKSRAVTIFQFKRACQLPKLKKLSINSKSCKLKSIRKYSGNLVGIYETSKRDSRRGDLDFWIDRALFSGRRLI